MARGKSKFRGADDVYLTEKSIAVRYYSTWVDKYGKYHTADKTKYYPKTSKNLRDAKSIFGWVRKGR